MGTFGPPQYPLGGGAEGVGPALASGEGVVLLVVDASVRDRAGGVEAPLLQLLGQFGGDADLSDQPSFAFDGVRDPFSAVPFAAEGRAVVGWTFGEGAQGE